MAARTGSLGFGGETAALLVPRRGEINASFRATARCFLSGWPPANEQGGAGWCHPREGPKRLRSAAHVQSATGRRKLPPTPSRISEGALTREYSRRSGSVPDSGLGSPASAA